MCCRSASVPPRAVSRGKGRTEQEEEDSDNEKSLESGLGWVVEGAVLEARRDHVLVAFDRKVGLICVCIFIHTMR